MQSHLTEEMKIKHFHAHLRRLTLKTFKKIQQTSSTTIEDISVFFPKKHKKPKSKGSGKQKFNRLMLQPENQKLREKKLNGLETDES